MQKSVMPLREAYKYVGQVVEVKGTPRFVKTLSDGKEGYIIKGAGGKIMCSSPEKLDSQPVVVRGRIKKVYGIVYLDVEKPGEARPEMLAPIPKPVAPEKKGFLKMFKKETAPMPAPRPVTLPPMRPTAPLPPPPLKPVPMEIRPEGVPVEKVRLIVTPEEIEKIEKMEEKKKRPGFFGRIKNVFGKPRKPEEKTKPLLPHPPAPKMMLPEEKKIMILKEAMRGKEEEKKLELTPLERPKKGLLEKLGMKHREKPLPPLPKEVKPTGGFMGGRFAPVPKVAAAPPPPAPLPKGKTMVVIRRPEELIEEKKQMIEKIKAEVPKKKIIIEKEKIQEVEWPPVVAKKEEEGKEVIVKKEIIKVEPKRGEIIEPPRDLPTKILGPQIQIAHKEPIELRELEEPTKVVSEIRQVARTPIDRLLATVRERKTVGIEQLSAELGVPEKVIENWARILEEHKLLLIEYPPIGKPKLVSHERIESSG